MLRLSGDTEELIDLIDKGILTINQAYIQTTRIKKERESRLEIRKNNVDNESKKNTPSIEFLQLRIIQRSLRCMLVFLKPEQSIYYPSSFLVHLNR